MAKRSGIIGPEPYGDDVFTTFYDNMCAEIRALGLESYRAEFDALETDLERILSVAKLKSARSLSLPEGGRTGKSEREARRYLEMAMNCTEPDRKLVLCNVALQHCPTELSTPCEQAKGGTVRDLYLAVALNRLWSLYELGKLSSGLAESERLLAEPALAGPVDSRVQLLVERARFQTALGRRQPAEASIQDTLQVLRQLAKRQQAMYAVELGTLRKRLASEEQPEADCSVLAPPIPSRLFQGEHAQMSRISSALDLAASEKRGRMLLANSDIPPGSVLIVDEPYAWSLHPPRWSTHCQNCCLRVDIPLPCQHCASVLFCSERCRSEAWLLFHQHECEVLDLLIDPNLGRMALLVYRILARAGPETLRQYFQPETAGPDGSLEPPLLPTAARYDSLSYRTVYAQVTNSELRPMGDMVKRCSVAMYLTACLSRVGLVPADSGAQTTALALRHLQSCSCNAYEITELRLTAGGVQSAEFEELGGAVYAAVSLTNHSCFPNGVRTSYGRAVAVTNTRALRPGEELTDNYGFQFHEEEETSRYAALQRQYQFGCECAACENSWPLYAQLPDGPPPGADQRRAVELLVQGRHAEAAAALAAVVAEDGKVEGDHPPHKQLVQRQSLFSRCIQSQGNFCSE